MKKYLLALAALLFIPVLAFGQAAPTYKGQYGAQIPAVVIQKQDGAGNTQDIDSSHPLNVQASSLPLPAGAATQAGVDTANASLSSLVTNTAITDGTQVTLTNGGSNTTLASGTSAGYGSVEISLAAIATSATVKLQTRSDSGAAWVDMYQVSTNGTILTSLVQLNNSTYRNCFVIAGHDWQIVQTGASAGTTTGTATLKRNSSCPVNPVLVANSVAIGATSTSGGVAATVRLLSAAASTNATLVKNAAGRAYRIEGYNASAPTCGTDTPIRTTALAPSAPFTISWADIGYYFSTGIGFCLTTGSADNDTGALTSGDVVGMSVDYQ